MVLPVLVPKVEQQEQPVVPVEGLMVLPVEAEVEVSPPVLLLVERAVDSRASRSDLGQSPHPVY